ncbi:helix-turn-helix domain-containing protein [Aerococcus urinaeequi]|uniref:MutR family transcriptional regulator n=1 Tax=Aerococcus urinaeequi TaxID=51665 RepID=A0AAC8X0Q7_9LACT|nr:Rgg/GadR/MutR family transcriptional regulator [Aerococcus urinaeequi]AMB97678.1 MutR family transcriptional regulator [Aerococcus urinaeequi]
MNIGTKYRDLRTERGLTLKDATTGEISYSQLSKFERGESSITIHHLVNLVHNLGISFSEFIAAIEKFDSPYKLYIEEIDSAYKQGDIAALKMIIQTHEKLYLETNQVLFRYNAIMTKLLLNDLTEVEIAEADKVAISDYILNCSIWTTYEVILLGNSLRGLTMSLQDLLVHEMVKKLSTLQETDAIKSHLLSILINVCFDRLRSGRTDEVNDIMAAIEPQLSTNAYYFKNRLLFLKGIVAIVQGQTDEGVAQCQTAIQVFELFDPPFAKMHEDELNSYLTMDE